MEPKEIKENLRNQMSKVRTFIYGSESNLFGLPEVNLTDYEVHTSGLVMVLISIKFETTTDPDLYGILDTIKHITKNINDLMYKIAFNKEGKMVRPSGDVVSFSGGILVSDMTYSFRTDDIITMEIDSMFNRPY
jgi:hypothetical protein